MAPHDPRTTPRLGSNLHYSSLNTTAHDVEPKAKRKRVSASMWDGDAPSAQKRVRAEKSTEPQYSKPPKGHEGATSWHEDHPPASHAKYEDGEPDTTQPPPAKAYTQDPDDVQLQSTPQHKTSRQQEGELTREMGRAVFGSPSHQAAQPGREGTARAAMFTNAQINAIHGGTFLNVANIHECDSGGGPAFPIMVLGLQAVSFATRSHYPHCNHPSSAVPLLIPEVMSTSSSLAVHLPLVYQEMKVALGPLALWLLVKMWIQRRIT